MKKTIKLIDLDCGHCAAKIENAVKKIDGVTNVYLLIMNTLLINSCSLFVAHFDFLLHISDHNTRIPLFPIL